MENTYTLLERIKGEDWFLVIKNRDDFKGVQELNHPDGLGRFLEDLVFGSVVKVEHRTSSVQPSVSDFRVWSGRNVIILYSLQFFTLCTLSFLGGFSKLCTFYFCTLPHGPHHHFL